VSDATNIGTLLAGGKGWTFVTQRDVPQYGTVELTRRMDRSIDALDEAILRWLRQYVDGKNYEADPTKTYFTVTNPICGGKTYPGVWRVVSNTFDPKQPGVVQRLRLGMLTSFTDWTEARFARKQTSEANTNAVSGIAEAKSDNPEHSYQIVFPYVDARNVSAFIDSLRGASLTTGPTIEGQTLEGGCHFITAWFERNGGENVEGQGDGSCTVIAVIAKQRYMLEGYEALLTGSDRKAINLWEVPKDLAQAIITAWNNGSAGRAANARFNASGRTVDITLYENSLWTGDDWNTEGLGKITTPEFWVGLGVTRIVTYWYGLTNAQRLLVEAGVVDVITPAAGAGTDGRWLRDIDISRGDDGRYRVTVRLDKGHAVDNAIVDMAQSAFETSTDTTNLNASASASAPSSEVGKIKSAEARINDFYLFDNKTSERVAVSYPSAVTETRRGALETVVERTDRNMPSAPSVPSAATVGEITTVRDQINDFARHDATHSTRTAVSASASAVTGGTVLVGETTERKRNVEVADLSAPTPSVAGTQVSADFGINEFGKLDTSKQVRTAASMSASASTGGTVLVGEVTTQQVNLTTAPDVAPGAVGTAAAANFSINQFGLIDANSQLRTAASMSASASTGGTVLVGEITEQHRNVSAFDVAPGSVGTAVAANISINEFGRLDGSKQTRTAVSASASASTGGGPLVTEVTEQHRNVSAFDTAAGSTGTNVAANISINEFGRLDGSRQTRTAVSASASADTGGSPLATEVTTALRNVSAFTAATPSAGTTVGANISINEFGRLDASQQVRTAVSSVVSASTGGTVLLSEVTTQSRNVSSADVAAASVAGTGTDGSISINEFGLLDATNRTRTAASASASASTGGTVLVGETSEVHRNVSSFAASAPSVAGTSIGASISMTELGLLDAGKQVRTATSASVSASTGGNFFYDETTEIKRNVSSAGGVTPSTPGTQIDHGISMNEFGLIDATKREQQAKVTDTGWLEYTSGNKTVKYRAFGNFPLASVQSIASDFPSGNDGNALSANVNSFGLLDGTAVQTITASSLGIWPYSPASGYDYRRIDLDGVDEYGQVRYVLDRITWEIRYFATKHQAYDEIDGGCTGTGSKPEAVESRLWETYVVTKIERSAPTSGGMPSSFPTTIETKTAAP
jgi:hypothetical protein